MGRPSTDDGDRGMAAVNPGTSGTQRDGRSAPANGLRRPRNRQPAPGFQSRSFNSTMQIRVPDPPTFSVECVSAGAKKT